MAITPLQGLTIHLIPPGATLRSTPGYYLAPFQGFKGTFKTRSKDLHLQNIPRNVEAAVATFRLIQAILSSHQTVIRPQTGELIASSKSE
jgi:hypothetical protein